MVNEPKNDERRKHPRLDLIVKIEYQAAADFLADCSANVSRGGIFVATDKSFSIGEELAFDISFPGLLNPIRCRGEVRWRVSPEQETPEKPAGIGVAFRFSSEKDADEIGRLVESLSRKEAPAAQAGEVKGPFRVLLAEDCSVVREMFRFAVQKFHGGFPTSQRSLDVVEAENGSEAWELLQQGSFDMAIIDFYMPVMNGGELVRKIRASDRFASLPVVVVSVGGEEVGREVYSAGADLFLKKPVLLTQLLDSLGRLLRLKEEKTGA